MVRPTPRAWASVASEVATQRSLSPASRTRRPSASTRKAAVEPVPRPTVMPSSIRAAAASPTARL